VDREGTFVALVSVLVILALLLTAMPAFAAPTSQGGGFVVEREP
jgi:hypothetical protein